MLYYQHWVVQESSWQNLLNGVGAFKRFLKSQYGSKMTEGIHVAEFYLKGLN